jgi:hypothetical protein
VLLAVVTLAAALIGGPAQAVPVTVGGTTYDVQFFPDGQSFNDNVSALTPPNAPPWWGSSTQASAFANAYDAHVSTPFPFDDPALITDYIFFAYANSGTSVSFAYLSENGSTGFGATGETSSTSTWHYAYTTPLSAVPEIDGNALAQAGLILLALFLVLRGRRPDLA